MTEMMSLTNPAFVTGQAFLVTDYLSAWYCKNSDICWKEDKSIPGIISDKQPFEKFHHLWHNFSLFIPVTPWMVNEKPYSCNEIWHPSPWVLQALSTSGIPLLSCHFVLVRWSWHKVLVGVSVLCFQRWNTRKWGGALMGLSSHEEFLQSFGSERFSEKDWNSHTP